MPTVRRPSPPDCRLLDYLLFKFAQFILNTFYSKHIVLNTIIKTGETTGMSGISAQLVKELRDKTGAGMMDCKKALSECEGDIESAIQALRKKGLKGVEKRAGRVAAEGTVGSYIHSGGRIGVLVEVNCETDFVGRGDEFGELVRRIAMHIAWSNPKFVSREEIPASDLEKEKEVYRSQLKPAQEKMADKIIEGKLEKFYESVCLLEQIDVQDQSAKKTIAEIVNDASVSLGEKIVIRRFQRFEVGEGIEKDEVDYAAEVAAAAGAA